MTLTDLPIPDSTVTVTVLIRFCDFFDLNYSCRNNGPFLPTNSSCGMLHNIALKCDDPEPPEAEPDLPEEELRRWRRRGACAYDVCNIFATPPPLHFHATLLSFLTASAFGVPPPPFLCRHHTCTPDAIAPASRSAVEGQRRERNQRSVVTGTMPEQGFWDS